MDFITICSSSLLLTLLHSERPKLCFGHSECKRVNNVYRMYGGVLAHDFLPYLQRETISVIVFSCLDDEAIPKWRSSFNPIALRMAKTPYNPIALRMAKTLLSFGCSECNSVK